VQRNFWQRYRDVVFVCSALAYSDAVTVLNSLMFFYPCESASFDKGAKVIFGLSRYNKTVMALG